MDPTFANDHAFFFCTDERLDNDGSRAPQHPKQSVAPIGDTRHPQHIGKQRIGLTHQLTVLFPILSVGVMRKMHHLIVIAWKNHHKADETAKHLIRFAVRKYRGMAQLMLRGVKKIDQNAQNKTRHPHPARAKSKAVQIPGDQDRPNMASHLTGAPQVRAHI